MLTPAADHTFGNISASNLALAVVTGEIDLPQVETQTQLPFTTKSLLYISTTTSVHLLSLSIHQGGMLVAGRWTTSYGAYGAFCYNN